MPVTINASPTNGIVQTADGSGVMKLQSNGVTTNALAWVNFNGTGTVAIRSAYNVSSITDNGTGNYTVNFTTATSDANYACVGSNGTDAPSGIIEVASSGTTTAQQVYSKNASNNTTVDQSRINVIVFGN